MEDTVRFCQIMPNFQAKVIYNAYLYLVHFPVLFFKTHLEILLTLCQICAISE